MRLACWSSLVCAASALHPGAPALSRGAAAAPRPYATRAARTTAPHALEVVSPFDQPGSPPAPAPIAADAGPLPLTWENVDMVLDDMRPYLVADGGNVQISEIDGGVVKLELQGACGTCPSSTMTMKMGLERGLRERIPEIVSVEQAAASGPQLTEEGVNEVLDEIRPFLKMAGGTVELVELRAGDIVPTANLLITGSGATINSVRVEIAQRLRRNFPTLANVTWELEDGKPGPA